MIHDIITDPDHKVIGNYFKAHAKFDSGEMSAIYYCDSYDADQGYWMTSLTQDHRCNVSERAIENTFHTVWHNDPEKMDSLHCTWGKLKSEEVEIIRNHIAKLGVTPYNLRLE